MKYVFYEYFERDDKMRIWKAMLILSYDNNDNLVVRFSFDLQEKEYRINEKFKEWVFSESWVSDRIPMEMKVEKTGYNGITVVQGFDNELSDIELILLETKMRKLMKEQLDYEMEIYKEDYLKKINVVWVK